MGEVARDDEHDPSGVGGEMHEGPHPPPGGRPAEKSWREWELGLFVSAVGQGPGAAWGLGAAAYGMGL